MSSVDAINWLLRFVLFVCPVIIGVLYYKRLNRLSRFSVVDDSGRNQSNADTRLSKVLKACGVGAISFVVLLIICTVIVGVFTESTTKENIDALIGLVSIGACFGAYFLYKRAKPKFGRWKSIIIAVIAWFVVLKIFFLIIPVENDTEVPANETAEVTQNATETEAKKDEVALAPTEIVLSPHQFITEVDNLISQKGIDSIKYSSTSSQNGEYVCFNDEEPIASGEVSGNPENINSLMVSLNWQVDEEERQEVRDFLIANLATFTHSSWESASETFMSLLNAAENTGNAEISFNNYNVQLLVDENIILTVDSIK